MDVDVYQILVAKVWRQKLDYAKNLQAKYFTGENIPIYGIIIKQCNFYKNIIMATKSLNTRKFCAIFGNHPVTNILYVCMCMKLTSRDGKC